ncbi:MAG: hypothetical protein ACRYF0_12255 [Janthinobacterium lividum]
MAFPLQFLLEQALHYTLMPKDKKKHAKKKDELSDDLLDMAALSLKKFRKVSKEISKLSTGQKLVGGVALLAAGLAYLAQQQASEAAPEAEAGTSATLLESKPKRKKASPFAAE